MQKLTVTIIIIAAMAGASGLRAQSMSDTLTWQVNQLTDLKTNNSFAYNCTFNTFGKNSITWVQGGGSFVNTLQVSQVDGAWNDVTQPGSMSYSVTLGEKSGSLLFERTGAGIFITIDFTSTGGQKQRYSVTTIQKN